MNKTLTTGDALRDYIEGLSPPIIGYDATTGIVKSYSIKSMNKSLEDKITDVEMKLLDISINLSETIQMIVELKKEGWPVPMTPMEVERALRTGFHDTDK